MVRHGATGDVDAKGAEQLIEQTHVCLIEARKVKVMTPAPFPESNAVFRRPPDMHEQQCQDVGAYWGEIQGGSLDGQRVVVVAWQPSPEEIAAIQAGKPVFLSTIGGLPPHFLSTDFHTATHPA